MNDFKKGGGFKKNFGGRPSFGGDRNGGGRPGSGEFKQMYQATCADCGNSCEVPFRPTGERPVYCRDCFAKNAPAPSSRDSGFKKPFQKFENRGGMRPAFQPRPSFAPRADAPQNGELVKQIEMLNTKIDRLIQSIETKNALTQAGVAEAAPKAARAPKKAAPKNKKK